MQPERVSQPVPSLESNAEGNREFDMAKKKKKETAAEHNRRTLDGMEIVSESPEAAKERNAKEKPSQKAPDRIRAWVTREFNAKYVEQVTQDLIDVATGNREGNTLEKIALDKIFPELAHLHQPVS